MGRPIAPRPMKPILMRLRSWNTCFAISAAVPALGQPA